MKVLNVVGARPNFMKAAPIIKALKKAGSHSKITSILVHTGQHYDLGMSETFFHDLELPVPDIYLGVGSGVIRYLLEKERKEEFHTSGTAMQPKG